TVSLNWASATAVTVTYWANNGTATVGNDFYSATATMTFNPGETSKTVTVQGMTDIIKEPDEGFYLDLSNARGAAIGRSPGIGTILNDDTLPGVSVGDASPVTEGNSGTTTAVFTVYLTEASSSVVTANYGTGTGSASAGVDFQAVSGTLTFNP